MNDFNINSLIETKLSRRSKDVRLESIKISAKDSELIIKIEIVLINPIEKLYFKETLFVEYRFILIY